jgi:hypothetical protein
MAGWKLSCSRYLTSFVSVSREVSRLTPLGSRAPRLLHNRPSPAGVTTSCLSPVINVLLTHVCRYLYTRILLLRPAILIRIDDPDMTDEAISSHDRLIIHAIDCCVSSSSRLLDILRSNLDSHFRVADWHVVYSKHCYIMTENLDKILIAYLTVAFTAVTSLLAVKKHNIAQVRELHVHIENMIERSRQIFRYMEPRIPICTQALHSLEIINGQIAIQIGNRDLITGAQSVVHSEEQGIDGGLGDLDSFDWLANPTALLSRQTTGLDMSWLTGSSDWFN